jgi:hypothetical protein
MQWLWVYLVRVGGAATEATNDVIEVVSEKKRTV